MEKTVSNRGIRRLYWAVSACFIVLAAWLYCKEGPYVKIMDISVVPQAGRLEADIVADGKNVKVSAGDKGVSLFVEESYEGGRPRLLIYGECEEGRQAPVDIKVASDSHDWQEAWTCQVLVGTQAGETRLHAVKNRARDACLWISLFFGIFMGVFWLRREKSKIHRDLEAYSNKVIERLGQEPGMERCCKEGRRLFAAYESQKVLMLLLVTWLWLFWFFRVMGEVNHGGYGHISGGYRLALLTGFLLAAVLEFAASVRWGRLSKGLLTEECRPVTGAVTYLLMGNYGIERKWSRFLLYHNGASGLYRSGHCKEALEISDMAWGMLKKEPRDYIVYVHSSLKYQCLKVLEEDEAAKQEGQRMEALLAKNPGWKKRKGIQRFLGIQDICQWMETGEIERAEKSARDILGQWKEGYYRLPVLGFMAELKDFLGKEEEAAKLREEILTFSPENIEVRQAMGKGRLSYHGKKAKAWDAGLMVIYGGCVCGIAAILFVA